MFMLLTDHLETNSTSLTSIHGFPSTNSHSFGAIFIYLDLSFTFNRLFSSDSHGISAPPTFATRLSVASPPTPDQLSPLAAQ